MKDSLHMPGGGALATLNVSGLRTDGDSLKFDYEDRLGRVEQGFVMRWGNGFLAYQDRCPHWSIPMEQSDGRMMNAQNSYILCPMHGALFEPESGVCFQGPCEGDRLEKFTVLVVDEDHVEIHQGRVRLQF